MTNVYGRWYRGRPPAPGYYLGAWRRDGKWFVSELWYNPNSIGTGWWISRGYLDQIPRVQTETIPVEAWMLKPLFQESP